MKIQILGPEARNKNIIEVLSTKHELFFTENDVSSNDLKNKGVEFVLSNGYAPILKSPIIEALLKWDYVARQEQHWDPNLVQAI